MHMAEARKLCEAISTTNYLLQKGIVKPLISALAHQGWCLFPSNTIFTIAHQLALPHFLVHYVIILFSRTKLKFPLEPRLWACFSLQDLNFFLEPKSSWHDFPFLKQPDWSELLVPWDIMATVTRISLTTFWNYEKHFGPLADTGAGCSKWLCCLKIKLLICNIILVMTGKNFLIKIECFLRGFASCKVSKANATKCRGADLSDLWNIQDTIFMHPCNLYILFRVKLYSLCSPSVWPLQPGCIASAAKL